MDVLGIPFGREGIELARNTRNAGTASAVAVATANMKTTFELRIDAPAPLWTALHRGCPMDSLPFKVILRARFFRAV